MGRKKTTEEWIEEARGIWGHHYDYSKSQYTGKDDKILVVCPNKDHGEFNAVAGNHVQKNRPAVGCPKCKNERLRAMYLKPFKQFVIDARKVHGTRYEYDEGTYQGTKIYMDATCPVHGEIKILPDSHINGGHGCKKCATEKNTSDLLMSRFLSLQNKIRILSKNVVDISPINFRGQNYDANFTCSLHGEYTRKPIASLVTSHPCINCLKELGVRTGDKLSKEEIRQRVGLLKGNFVITGIEGVGSKDAKIHITCLDNNQHPKICTTLDNLYSKDYACGRCSHEAAQPQRTASLIKASNKKVSEHHASWLQRAVAKHGGKYDYSLVDYRTAKDPVIIICPIHGSYPQVPDTHLTSGCRFCADENLKGRYTFTYFARSPEEKAKFGRLYYIQITAFNKVFFKVGITLNTLAKRFASAKSAGIKIKVLKQKEMSIWDAFCFEQEILKRVRKDIRHSLSDEECLTLQAGMGGISEIFNDRLSSDISEMYFSHSPMTQMTRMTTNP